MASKLPNISREQAVEQLEKIEKEYAECDCDNLLFQIKQLRKWLSLGEAFLQEDIRVTSRRKLREFIKDFDAKA